MLLFAQKTTDSPQLEAATSALNGVIVGLVLAVVVGLLLERRNLRGSLALWPCLAGGWICLTWIGDPFLGAMLITTGLLPWGFVRLRIGGAIKAGGELGDRARRARTIREVARNWWDRRRLARYGAIDWPGYYAIGEDESRAVVRVPLGRHEGRHTLLLGATGSGKTTTLAEAVWRHLDAGCGAIVIDPKGDRGLVERAREEARAHARAFYCFSLDSPRQRWNPLALGTPSEKADKLIGAEEWTEPHYKRLYQRYLLNVFTAVEARGQTAHLALVVELLDPDRLAMYCRAIDGKLDADRLAGYLEQLTADEAATSVGCATGSRC